jgi:membrane protein YdbS with pleckstrin-like domain
MGYVEKNLVDGESVTHRARYHWVIYRSSLLLMLLAVFLGTLALYAWRSTPSLTTARWIGLAALVCGAVAGLVAIGTRIRISADEFVVTNRRVIRKVGLVSREIEQAPLDKIQDITVDQSWLGRLFGFGTVTLETASERGTLIFPRIAQPEGMRNALWGHSRAAEPEAQAPGLAPSAAPSTGARLAELDRLRRQGLLSDDEYSRKRREILSRL